MNKKKRSKEIIQIKGNSYKIQKKETKEDKTSVEINGSKTEFFKSIKERKEKPFSIGLCQPDSSACISKLTSISAFQDRSICVANKQEHINAICLLARIDDLRPLLAFGPAIPTSEHAPQRELSDQTSHFTGRSRNPAQRIPVYCTFAIASQCQVIDLSDWSL